MFGSDGPVSASTYNILCQSISATPFSLLVRPATFRGGGKAPSRKGGDGKVATTDRCSRLSNMYVVLPSIHSLMINCRGPKRRKKGKKEEVKHILACETIRELQDSFLKLKSQKYISRMNRIKNENLNL